MSSDFDELQEMVNAEARQIYSETVMDHAMNPRNVGSMENAEGFARFRGPCGDTMEIWIKVRDERITAASFYTDGCGTSIASGSMVTELAKGKVVEQALRITDKDVLKALDGLPEDSEHCALLAATTLKHAINDYRMNLREPWKRAYRKT